MQITQYAASAGVPASTIRYWEKVGLLPHPNRVGGKRCYAKNDVFLLKVIVAARKLGFSIKEIRKIVSVQGNSPEQRQHMISTVRSKLVETELQMRRLRERRTVLDFAASCQCKEIESCDVVTNMA